MNLMNLPIEMLDKILSYLSYDQIAKMRAVNRRLNMVCSNKLNKGFIHVNQFHGRCLKAVKTKLPRRESERRHHPLARHSDILMAVETRLSMLSMTFCKYVEAGQCCFIPGKVLDEALKVLRTVNNSLTPDRSSGQFPLLPRPHDFLQEYRDVSSMAMEHFDDKILPGIKEKMCIPTHGRLFCFKPKPEYLDAANIFVSHKAVEANRRMTKAHKVEDSQPGVASGSTTTIRIPHENRCELAKFTPMCRMYRSLQKNRMKYKSLNKIVDKLRRSFILESRQMKRENLAVKRQLGQQKMTIRVLRRELRETRSAMNVMSKDLNQIKIDQGPSRGTKRKRESFDEEDCELK